MYTESLHVNCMSFCGISLCPLSSFLLSMSPVRLKLLSNMDLFLPTCLSISLSFIAGPSIESAHQSGKMLADAIYERFEKGVKRDIGLDPTQYFQVHSHDNPLTVCLLIL
jgi:hypothetical protein